MRDPDAREPPPYAADRRLGHVLIVEELALTVILLVASFGASALLVWALLRNFPDQDGGPGGDDPGGPGPGRGGGPRPGGGPDRPPASPSGGPREPAWWPEFETAFAAYVEPVHPPSETPSAPAPSQLRFAERLASVAEGISHQRAGGSGAAYAARRTARTVPRGDDIGAPLRDHPMLPHRPARSTAMSFSTSADTSPRPDQRIRTDATAALQPSAGRPGATPQRDLVIASLLRFPQRGRAARGSAIRRPT